ncbi:c-di-AMP phosphodiesterase-like protein [Natranaerovirga pectinivora]|uniref:Cyclic-di-AMP phosphodiesterase n=1 Tax=Natranaerovirga pectinivora TaxID=682400 RepID=A0A4R3MII7_9FIRM|nr:DHH family phosphoesterase [Natranaerovirga pectinivora]TCT13134.1 c-di-AMP phosphodiesterase-like protein [Natranaerovirga pectinivora]
MKESKYQFNTKVERYFIWPAFYLLAFVLLSIIISIYDKKLGLISFIFCSFILIITILLHYVVKKKLMSEVINFALDFGVVQKNLLYNFPIPYIVLDNQGKIRWYNEKFEKLCVDDKILNKPISSIVQEINYETLINNKDSIKHIQIGENFYELEVKPIYVNEINEDKSAEFDEPIKMYAVYLFDETKIKDLQSRIKDQKTVIGLLYIDNFEEALQSIEEVRRPLLVALIDRNINKFAQNIDAVVRKFEKDKYFFIFQHKYLHQLQSNKFAILDDIRAINIGNEMPVTLSMGIGVNGKSFTQSVEFARTSIDLALGRGGDQAVVKDMERLYYYGGKTKDVEKSTRVKTRVKAHAFRELLEGKDKVIIMGHKLQDLDSLGAAIGIYRAAKTLNKKAYIVLKDITTSVRPLYELFKLDAEYEEDMFLKNEEAIEKADNNTLLVVVDVNRPSYTECPELLEIIPNIVVFDHHRVSSENIENAVLSYIEPYASSTCEMVAELIQYMSEKIKLKPLEADALFAGITVDTKNFMVKTGVKTFEAAAFLRRNGADVVRVRKLFRNDMESYKARAEAIKNAEIYKDSLAITFCPGDKIESPTIVAAQTADELLNISGIKASFVLTQIENTIYISSRSIDDINVQLIMEKLGGGGHLNVAGAQLVNFTVEDALDVLKDKIDELIEEGEL